jgi:hypothetical protein
MRSGGKFRRFAPRRCVSKILSDRQARKISVAHAELCRSSTPRDRRKRSGERCLAEFSTSRRVPQQQKKTRGEVTRRRKARRGAELLRGSAAARLLSGPGAASHTARCPTRVVQRVLRSGRNSLREGAHRNMYGGPATRRGVVIPGVGYRGDSPGKRGSGRRCGLECRPVIRADVAR